MTHSITCSICIPNITCNTCNHCDLCHIRCRARAKQPCFLNQFFKTNLDVSARTRARAALAAPAYCASEDSEAMAAEDTLPSSSDGEDSGRGVCDLHRIIGVRLSRFVRRFVPESHIQQAAQEEHGGAIHKPNRVEAANQPVTRDQKCGRSTSYASP